MKKYLLFVTSFLFVLALFIPGQTFADEETIDVGIIFPMSGAASSNAERVKDGMNLALDHINGEILGKEVNLIFEDNRLNPSESVSLAEKLIEKDKVDIIIGAYASSSTLAILPLTEEYEVPHLVIVSTSPKVTETGSDWVFRLTSTNGIDAERHAETLVKELGFTKNAYMPVDNDWGLSVAKAFPSALEKYGAEHITTESVAMGETNYSPQLTTIMRSGANSIIATQDVEYLSMIVTQRLEAGAQKLNFLSTSGTTLSLVKDIAGDQAAEGIYAIEYYLPPYLEGGDFEENIKFFEASIEKYDYEPDYFNAQGYVTVKVIEEAINEAGTIDRAAIRDSLENIEMDTIRGKIKFDETGQSYTNTHIFKVENGELTLIE